MSEPVHFPVIDFAEEREERYVRKWNMTSQHPAQDLGEFTGTRREAVAEAQRLGREGTPGAESCKVYTEPTDTRTDLRGQGR